MFDVRGTRIAVVKHTYYDSGGTPDAELIRYLRGKAAAILDILHPFPDAKTLPLNTRVVEYGSDGGESSRWRAPLFRGHPVLFYIKDFVLTLYIVMKSGAIYDLYVGCDNLNAFSGLVLKLMGRVRRVAYYVIDFTPHRFENRVMNAVYQALNKLCCYHADVVWNVSERMIGGREEIGIRRDLSAQQITVPLGCDFGSIPRRDGSEVDPRNIVYFGTLRREHGPGLIIEALPRIVGEEPAVTVTFAGGGELREELERRADELGVSSHVRFTGFIESGEEIYRTLASAGLALATYPFSEGAYKSYSDPGKVKIYLACGLPVLITDVPHIAGEIGRAGAGRIVGDDPGSLADAVLDIVRDDDGYTAMRERAIELARKYDWDAIWERTFGEMAFTGRGGP